MMMIMINKDISQTPYFMERPSNATTPMSTFNSQYSISRPAAALAVTMVAEKQAPSATDPSPSKKRRCRKVFFGPDVTLAYIESSCEFTQSEKDDRWYRSTQISSFKEEARKLCRTRIEDVRNEASIPRHSVRSGQTSVSTKAFMEEPNGDLSEDSVRGLDVYYPSRQRFNKKFIQHVLEAYHVRCAGNEEHVALLSEKWSKKNLHRALDVAKKDFFAAYFPHELECEDHEHSTLASTLMRNPQQPQGPKILATTA